MAYILVVDDDEDFVCAVQKVLGDAGHEVATELDTGSAANRMAERTPDLVVLDVMFPESSSAGFDLARAMRQKEALCEVPILLLTAVNQRFPLGFSASDIDDEWMPVHSFLEKPVDLDILVRKVDALLSQAGGSPPAESR